MQFDFGKNWEEYSNLAISAARVKQARDEFAELLQPTGGVSGKLFLDIGFGQGLSLLAAAASGARVVGVDISPTCAEVLQRNQRFFPELKEQKLPAITGSILDDDTVQKVREASSDREGYDIVHSWGVLHHTGNMLRAISNAARLVKPRGYLVVALYNRHWSSRPWLLIKFIYCKSPPMLQKLLIWVLFPVIYAAKWIVTGSDPRRQARGMDFYFNVVDWVGGYPYEYASEAEVLAMVEPLGFKCIRSVQSEVPTGCNEFVFQHI